MTRTALVLSGGGARAAYQVGVLVGLDGAGIPAPRPLGHRRVRRLERRAPSTPRRLLPTPTTSATDCGELEAVWRAIEPQQVFRTDIALARPHRRALGVGPVVRRRSRGTSQPKSLLDTSAAAHLLARRIPFAAHRRATSPSGVARALAAGRHRPLHLERRDLLQAQPGVRPWTRRRWRIEPTRIGVDHLMASSAIPIFFPSGPDRRPPLRRRLDPQHRAAAARRSTSAPTASSPSACSGPPPPEPTPAPARRPPTIAQIAGVLLDAVMLDAIEVDVEHSERVNRAWCAIARGESGDAVPPGRRALAPALGAGAASIAAELADRIPAIVRYLMRGLGSDAVDHRAARATCCSTPRSAAG